MEKLIAIKRNLKKNQPRFTRQDAHKKPEINPKWRKPKGLHSKIRLKKKGYRRMPGVGYRSPKAVRGFDLSGLKPVLIRSLGQLESIAKDKQGIIIASSLGNRKRLQALKFAKEKGIKVFNIIKPEEYAKKIEDAMAKKKEMKKKKAEKKDKREKEEKEKPKAEKKEEKKDESGVEGMISEEEKKIKDKKEKDKTLIKKELQ